jgi:hypothetical protein
MGVCLVPGGGEARPSGWERSVRSVGDPVASAEPGLRGRWLEHVAVDGDAAPAGKQLAGVVKDDHTVAQQAPSLFWVVGDQTGRIVIGSLRGWTGWLMHTHRIHAPIVELRNSLSHQHVPCDAGWDRENYRAGYVISPGPGFPRLTAPR